MDGGVKQDYIQVDIVSHPEYDVKQDTAMERITVNITELGDKPGKTKNYHVEQHPYFTRMTLAKGLRRLANQIEMDK